MLERLRRGKAETAQSTLQTPIEISFRGQRPHQVLSLTQTQFLPMPCQKMSSKSAYGCWNASLARRREARNGVTKEKNLSLEPSTIWADSSQLDPRNASLLASLVESLLLERLSAASTERLSVKLTRDSVPVLTDLYRLSSRPHHHLLPVHPLPFSYISSLQSHSSLFYTSLRYVRVSAVVNGRKELATSPIPRE